MSDDIKVFGLVNGMELIGTIASEDDVKFTLKNALALNIQPSAPQSSEIKLQLIPPTFFSDAEQENGRKGVDLELYKTSILFVYKLRDNILQQYTLQTGKIIIAHGSIK